MNHPITAVLRRSPPRPHASRSLRLAVPTALLALALLLAGPGCRPSTRATPDRLAPQPNAPALYSNVPPPRPAAFPAPGAARVQAAPSLDPRWTNTPFTVLRTELTPATLVRSRTRYLGLFCDLPAAGLGAPAQVAWSTKDGPRTFKPGTTHDASGLEENWLLVWFSGATNWTNWDAPWAVFLQRKPSWLRLDDQGLHLEFPRETGDVVLLPLYGLYTPPPAGRDPLAEHGLPAKKLKTWEWEKGLARDPLTRLRFWAGATRRLPVACEETFSVDRHRDAVTFRFRYTWHAIADDWNTRPIPLAPVSPALALAARDPEFPVRFSTKPADMELPTLFGPYFAAQGVDTLEATLPVLQYLHETEANEPPDAQAPPVVSQARDRLQQEVRTWAGGPGPNAFPTEPAARLAAVEELLAFAPALPFLDTATRSLAQSKLTAAVQALARSGPLPPGIEPLLQAYGQHTGDWPGVRALLGTSMSLPPGRTWAGFGAATGPEVTRDPARCAALARLAWQQGDLNAYHQAAASFARALTQLWSKQRGADWFRKQQPWRTLEWMDDEVFLTGLHPVNGWSIDGPRFPADATQRAFTRRWQGCDDPDVARFCREYLLEDVRRELNWLQAREPRSGLNAAAPGPARSMVQLRALLLRETPAELASVAAPKQFSGSTAGVAGSCLGVLRAQRPARTQRLIPGGPASPFLAVADATNAAAPAIPVTQLELCPEILTPKGPQLCWPELTWPAWRTPAGRPWSFGSVKPVREGPPASVHRLPLNATTEAVTCTLP